MAYPHDDDSDEFDVPPGGSFYPEEEDRAAVFVRSCRANAKDIRMHRFEMHNIIRRLLELQMKGTRSPGLLSDFRQQVILSATFCNRLGAPFLKGAGLSPAWRDVFVPVKEADKWDPDAWFTRGYRVTLGNMLAAAMLVNQLLLEAETIATAPGGVHVTNWLREVYGMTPDDEDIPF